MSVVRNARRRELYNCEMREGWRRNLREREEGREGGGGRGERFFHCMPAAALISWSILVNSFRKRQTTVSLKVDGRGKLVFSST